MKAWNVLFPANTMCEIKSGCANICASICACISKKSFFGPPGIKLTFFENFLRHHLALFLGFLCYFDGPERGGHVLEVGSKRMIWKMEVV